MGIIKWWNDVWNKPAETSQGFEVGSKAPTTRAGMEEMTRKLNPEIKGEPALPIGREKVEIKVFDNDADRVEHYKASGGEIVDLTNRPRKENDGFAPDGELLHPWNEAHRGMKDGLMRGGRR
jgi:hypothetical protein